MDNESKVVSVKEWLISLIITVIPVVGIIMLFVWAFGERTNPNKANLAKAFLLFHIIAIALFLIIGIFGGSLAYFNS
ncbi:hypothetical protein [Maribacter sp. 2308TA10-17]|uniref:hypothetical protein n=1 Tax=Maribacter sp. 2308TA10-17 TaxID=3386276 RepID=UPI0039BD784B